MDSQTPGAGWVPAVVVVRERERDAGRSAETAGPAQRRTTPSVNIPGDGNAVSFAIGDNSTATATATPINVDQALLLAHAVRDALPMLDLGDDVEAHLTDIEQTNDPERMRHGLEWLANVATNTSTGALGSVLGMAAATLLGLSPG